MTIFNEVTNAVKEQKIVTGEWKKKNHFRVSEKSCLNCKHLEYDTYSHCYSCTKLEQETGYGYLGMLKTTVQPYVCDKYKHGV